MYSLKLIYFAKSDDSQTDISKRNCLSLSVLDGQVISLHFFSHSAESIHEYFVYYILFRHFKYFLSPRNSLTAHNCHTLTAHKNEEIQQYMENRPP